MSNAPIDEGSGKAYWQIADQIPNVHHWPVSDRLPVDDSLPRHAFDIRGGVQWRIGRRLDDLLERCILRPISRLLMGCLDVLEWWRRARYGAGIANIRRLASADFSRNAQPTTAICLPGAVAR